MKIHDLITTTDALADLCERLSKSEFVTVDTEFMRENTYWPELCLVQIANDKEAAAIDPLAYGIDLQPLLDLLTENEDVLKVFHAGGQDVEIIVNLTGKTPHPIFDTQIAMMAISQSEQIGYANLVESWLSITIDKGARFTDWSRRPLTDRQIEYAIGDVTHLADIFPRILKKLIKTGRGAWLDAEMEKLADPQNYANDADLAWKRIRSSGRNPAVLGRLKALAAWRESEAQHKNIPRRLTAITRSHSSVGISSQLRRSRSLISDALLISTSMRPKAESVPSTQGWKQARSVASKRKCRRVAVSAPKAVPSVSGRRAPRLREQPAAASRVASAAPMPRLAPEIITTRPLGDSMAQVL